MSQATQLFQSKLQNIRLAEYGGAEPRWANVVQSDPTQMGHRGGGYASQATAAVDTTGDGRANALVSGVDRNHDGIPDALQGGAMGHRGGATNRNTGILQSFRSDLQGMMNEAQTWRYTVCSNRYACTQLCLCAL